MSASSPKSSVIVCTYNPHPEVFKRCLEAISLAAREYPPHEIIVVDNNSPQNVGESEYAKPFFQSHSNARTIVEQQQGLTHARIRGIRESTGDLIIFIDDDNVVDSNYFVTASKIATQYPFIGAYSGRVTLMYETEPEQWTRRYWGMLIHRDFQDNRWSNLPFDNDTMPSGAGLCVTRDVAEEYVRLFNEGRRTFVLDRSKGSLMSGGDNDLAMCACDIGKGMGLFKDLHLRHYIPSERFRLRYLSNLAYGIYYSSAILEFMRTGKVEERSYLHRMKHLIRINVMKRKDRIIQKSCVKGLKDAIKLIESGRLPG